AVTSTARIGRFFFAPITAVFYDASGSSHHQVLVHIPLSRLCSTAVANRAGIGLNAALTV
ncbi:TPA: hypothetical protein ACGCAT_005020, partial [Serratia marcescens]